MNKLSTTLNLIKSMGFKPIAYRAVHTFKKKTGLLKSAFPSRASNKDFIPLSDWKNLQVKFFFKDREHLNSFTLDSQAKDQLAEDANRIKEGYIPFFNGEWRYLGDKYNWITNPTTNYTYNIHKHWTEIETLDPAIGDIKYVWEKSRFSFLYTLVRYDYHFREDQSEYVFSEILSWIEKNPLNMGPNYSCSQEISIRVLNWIFVLNYYKNSSALTEDRFKKIINSIYDQSRHVDKHLNFSLLTVRNNHAITECLLLFSVGLLFPFFSESNKWKEKGRKYLEQEGLYQIYKDGSYLQFSSNYERVVVQLYTWAFGLAKLNDDLFSPGLTQRLKKAVDFLFQQQDEKSGWLPNYGANDGALFFRLNNCEFRDYRPQLNALRYLLTGKALYYNPAVQEDLFWFTNQINAPIAHCKRETSAFDEGGYYVLRSPGKFAFIRCGDHPDRPSQADNLHLDIWYDGANILRDAGSYKYNTSPEDIKFFMGTASHNTVMIEEYDQMLKGGRFLWYYWTNAIHRVKIDQRDDMVSFEGSIRAFRHVSKGIVHYRTVKQYKKEVKWEIIDTIEGTNKIKKQLWNTGPAFYDMGFEIECKDEKNNLLNPVFKNVFYSPTYGVKEPSQQILFETAGRTFHTIISKR